MLGFLISMLHVPCYGIFIKHASVLLTMLYRSKIEVRNLQCGSLVEATYFAVLAFYTHDLHSKLRDAKLLGTKKLRVAT